MVAVVCSGGPQGAAQAQAAAEAWLAELDRGNYAACWERASPSLRLREERAAWVRTLEQSRAQVGLVIRRSLAEAHRDQPQAGGRPFINLVFRVERVADRAAGEFVGVEEGADGQWRVMGYRVVGLGGQPGGDGR